MKKEVISMTTTMEYVLLDENNEPLFSTYNEQELQFAMQFTSGKAEVWYYCDNEATPYKKEAFEQF